MSYRNATLPTTADESSRVRLRIISAEPTAADDDEGALEPLPARPRTRADCVDGPRPCPWFGCRMHLYLEVNERGTIRPNRGGEPGDMPAARSCALDVADRDEPTLEEIGELLGGLSRERIRQIEGEALHKFRIRGGAYLAELADADLADRIA